MEVDTIELFGIEQVAQAFVGNGCIARVQGKDVMPYEAIYGGYLGVQRSVKQDGCKLILYPKIAKIRLFNLREDPHEMNDLADDPRSGPLIKRLFAKLLQLQKETGDELDLKSVFPGL